MNWQDKLRMTACREIAAQCWCDPKNAHKEMDVDLTESIAARLFQERKRVDDLRKGVKTAIQQWSLKMNCQSIETAPKNGVTILLRDLSGDVISAWWERGEWKQGMVDAQYTEGGCSWRWCCDRFTHWMPLPEPPKETA